MSTFDKIFDELPLSRRGPSFAFGNRRRITTIPDFTIVSLAHEWYFQNISSFDPPEKQLATMHPIDATSDQPGFIDRNFKDALELAASVPSASSADRVVPAEERKRRYADLSGELLAFIRTLVVQGAVRAREDGRLERRRQEIHTRQYWRREQLKTAKSPRDHSK